LGKKQRLHLEKKMKMEIPTKNLDDRLDKLADTLLGDVSQPATRIKTVLDAREVIKAQALEIVELQAAVVRLRDESQMLTNELNKMEGA
jgi:hypothetical protein